MTNTFIAAPPQVAAPPGGMGATPQGHIMQTVRPIQSPMKGIKEVVYYLSLILS